MFSKIAVLFALVSTALAGIIHDHYDHSALLHGGHHHGHGGGGVSSQSVVIDNSLQSHGFHHDDHHYENSHPRYQFKYSVSDPVTRDEKSHSETRDGDNVQGEYSLLQPDGSTRRVTYTADAHNGFQAEVSTSGGNQHHHDLHSFDNYHHGFHH